MALIWLAQSMGQVVGDTSSDSVVIPVNQYNIVALNRDGDGATIDFYMNGTNYGGGSYTEVYNGVSTDIKSIIGARLVSGVQYGNNSFSGTIHELLVFDQPLSDEQSNKVHYYLSQKWGIADYVDSDGDGGMDNIDFIMGNQQLNRPPVFISSAPEEAIEGVEYIYSIEANDPENDDLIFLGSDIPEGVPLQMRVRESCIPMESTTISDWENQC